MISNAITATNDLAKKCRFSRWETADASAGGFYIRLTRDDRKFRLIVSRRDRRPSYEELSAIATAAGAPIGADEWAPTVVTLFNQDASTTRWSGLVVGWQQL